MEIQSDASTRQRVARHILETGSATASSLAEHFGLTAAAVRRHLDHLVEDGWVESREQRVYGSRGRGRPARTFHVTEAGRDHFEQSYDDLAAQALRYLAETQGDEAILAFARHRMSFVAREYDAVLAANPDLTPAQGLAKVLSNSGYAATVRDLPMVGEQLCQQHCPVSHVAAEFPQLCEAETEAFSAVLGTHLQRLATIAHGDGVCTTHIPHAARAAATKEDA